MRQIAGRLAIFAGAAAVTCTFFINLCNWIYRCGCESLWAGAAEHCNIHNETGRHCPFCSHGNAAYAGVLAWILIPQLIVSVWPLPWKWPMRLAVVLLVFPVACWLAAVVFGWLDGYWA